MPSTAPEAAAAPSSGHGVVGDCSDEQTPEQDGFRRTLADRSPTASLYTSHLSEVVNNTTNPISMK